MVTEYPVYGVNFWAVSAFPLGILIELILGRFRAKPDAKVIIGRLAERAERGLRSLVHGRGDTPRAELMAGVVLMVLVVGLAGGSAWFAVELSDGFGGPASLLVRTVLIAWGLSFGRLVVEVVRASEAGDLASARLAASEFAGIGSSRLDQAAIRKACVERLGSQANRLVVAPLFWLAIGGPAGLWSYQAVDTLGTKVVDGGPRSRYIGFASARLLDVANFVPARLTWLLMALSAALLGEDAGEGFRLGRAEGRRAPERPGVWGVATLMGALGLHVGADPVDASTVRRAVRITQLAGLHAAFLTVAYRIVIAGG